MGEVYRAHDSKLGRDVAIKVLPPSLAGNGGSPRRGPSCRPGRATAASFVSGRSLYVVSVAAGDDPEPGPPRLIMDNVDPSINTTNRIFDVAPDGSGFVIAKPANSRPAATAFDVIVNWRP